MVMAKGTKYSQQFKEDALEILKKAIGILGK